jgi:hypothetical protein
MNERGDEKRPYGEETQTSNSVAEPEGQGVKVPKEQTTGPPPPQRRSKYKKGRAYHYTYLASQIVIAIFASGGVIVAVCSLKSLNRSVRAANRQAAAAATQAQIAQQEYEASERPWVGLAGTEVLEAPTDTSLKVRIVYTNAGHSPASQVWFRGLAITPLDSDSQKRVEQWCEGRPTDAGVGSLLLPGQSHQADQYTEPLKAGTIGYIREQLGLRPKPSTPVDLHPEGVIMLGCIDYMWRDTCYRTRFCEQYNPVPSRERPFGFFGYCNFDNDTKENPHCKRHR